MSADVARINGQNGNNKKRKENKSAFLLEFSLFVVAWSLSVFSFRSPYALSVCYCCSTVHRLLDFNLCSARCACTRNLSWIGEKKKRKWHETLKASEERERQYNERSLYSDFAWSHPPIIPFFHSPNEIVNQGAVNRSERFFILLWYRFISLAVGFLPLSLSLYPSLPLSLSFLFLRRSFMPFVWFMHKSWIK